MSENHETHKEVVELGWQAAYLANDLYDNMVAAESIHKKLEAVAELNIEGVSVTEEALDTARSQATVERRTFSSVVNFAGDVFKVGGLPHLKSIDQDSGLQKREEPTGRDETKIAESLQNLIGIAGKEPEESKELTPEANNDARKGSYTHTDVHQIIGALVKRGGKIEKGEKGTAGKILEDETYLTKAKMVKARKLALGLGIIAVTKPSPEAKRFDSISLNLDRILEIAGSDNPDENKLFLLRS